jgi:hypothetical protein
VQRSDLKLLHLHLSDNLSTSLWSTPRSCHARRWDD